ncbi:putative Spindle-pole body protein [Taphrina deformans PYCC 5710]|uniref:Spindle-pole body protein n=1 Tax=Taphrina deformans (strain PYCC 5710 / ATCC 11124 / CBS 356.35 / IMI 108563 / JCM 9778 / NBRC 8474) TaxID=1097556 RepID=R4XAE9_TAPDE|nr:putative Spindle-pole body protein [Taphrina deformans PYCC 5710]|eukprot:CCG82482.1 putative Spindle-pole body protein [Taphrina deformans PYCC 5710]
MSGMFGIMTPHRTDTKVLDRSDSGDMFDEVDSFVEPAPKNAKNNSRLPFKSLSENVRKAGEFTPILRTATKKNRLLRYETPGERSDKSQSNLMENSALTPIHWTAKQPIADITNGSINDTTPDRSENHSGPGGIREQEKAMDKMKKENWELKLKVFMMEKQMFESSPEHVQLALKENIDYKVQVSSLSRDVATYKRALAETERKVASLGDQVSASLSQEECQLQHGMSEEDREGINKVLSEKEDLLVEKEEAEMRIRELEEEIDSLTQDQERTEQLEKELQQANIELEATRNHADELDEQKQQNIQLREQVEDLQDELRSLTAKHEDLLSQTHSGENDDVISLLREQLDEKGGVINSMTGQIRKLEREVQSSQDQCLTLSDRLQTLEARNDSLEADLEDKSLNRNYDLKETLEMQKHTLELQIATVTSENEGLNERLHTAHRQLSEVQHDLRERQEDIEELKGLAEDRSYEFRQIEQRLDTQEQKKKHDDIELVQTLETQILEAKLVTREQKRAMREFEQKVDALEHELSEAGKSEPYNTNLLLKSLGSKETSMKAELRELEVAMSNKSLQMQALERELTSSQQKNNTLTARARELEEEVRELESSDDVDSTQIQDRLREENQDLRVKIEDLEMQLREKEEEIELVAEDSAQVNSEISALRSSSSESDAIILDLRQQAELNKAQLADSRRLFQNAQDKIIAAEEARTTVQQQLISAKALAVQEEQKSLALNTSLLNVRSLLSDTQTSHKIEVQMISQARQAEQKAAELRYSDLESRLSTQVALHERSLSDAQAARKSLEETLTQHREQITSLEITVQKFSEADAATSADQRHFKDVLEAESRRHERSQQAAEAHITELVSAREALADRLEGQRVELEEVKSHLQTVKASERHQSQIISDLQSQVESLASQDVKAQGVLLASEGSAKELETLLKESASRIVALQDSIASTRREHQDELLKRSDELFGETQKTRDLAEKLHIIESKCLSYEQDRKRLSFALTSADQRLLSDAQRIEELTRQKTELEIKVEHFSEKDMDVAVVETERSQLRTELSNMEESLRTARIELEEVAAERDLLQEQVDEITERAEVYRCDTTTALRNLREELQTTQNTLISESERSSRAEANLEHLLAQEKAEAVREHNKFRLIISDLEESLKSTKQNHADLLTNLGSNASEVNALRSQCDKLEEELSRLRTENETLLTKGQDHENTQIFEDYELQLNELENDLKQSKLAHKNAKTQYDVELDTITSQHRNTVNELQNERDYLIEDLRKSEARLSELQAEYETQQERYQHLQADLKVQASKSEPSLKVDSRSTEVEDLKRQLATVQRDFSTQKSHVRSLEAELTRERKTDSRLHEDLEKAARRVRNLENEIAGKERKTNDMKALVSQKTEQNMALEQRLSIVQTQYRQEFLKNPNNTHGKSSSEKLQARQAEELAGISKLLRYMRSRMTREESFRADLSYIKSYYDKQISSFEACNQANLNIIQQIGIYPDETFRTRRTTFKNAVHVVMATVRMRKAAEAWSIERAEKHRIDEAMRSRKARDRGR